MAAGAVADAADAGRDPAGGAGDVPSPAASAPSGSAAPGRRRRIGMRTAAGLAAAAALVVLAAVAASRRRDPPPAPTYDPRRIAVLYLDDDSPGGTWDTWPAGSRRC